MNTSYPRRLTGEQAQTLGWLREMADNQAVDWVWDEAPPAVPSVWRERWLVFELYEDGTYMSGLLSPEGFVSWN